MKKYLDNYFINKSNQSKLDLDNIKNTIITIFWIQKSFLKKLKKVFETLDK